MILDAPADIPIRTGGIRVHAPEDFEGMRRAGRLAAECRDMLPPHVPPGVAPEVLDGLARRHQPHVRGRRRRTPR